MTGPFAAGPLLWGTKFLGHIYRIGGGGVGGYLKGLTPKLSQRFVQYLCYVFFCVLPTTAVGYTFVFYKYIIVHWLVCVIKITIRWVGYIP